MQKFLPRVFFLFVKILVRLLFLPKKDSKSGQNGEDEEALSSLGIYKTYTEENLRYSQTIPLDMYNEKNSGCNLPAQIDLMASHRG